MLRDPSLIPLSHDHHHALALCVLTTRSLASGESLETLSHNIVEHYQTELRRHFDLEERVLFPVLEHRRIEQLVESLRSSQERVLIEEFCTLLQQHVRKEESQLFEQAQRLLTRGQLDDLGAKLAPGTGPACGMPDR
jgi:hemerythrin-like domain-containing protein